MDQEKVGKIIKNIRTSNNLTQDEFAKMFGVTYQAVSKWENGRNLPDISIIKDICNKFNYDISDIVGVKKVKKSRIFLIISLVIFILLFAVSLILFFKKGDFTFKQISSTCQNFNVTGSVAYNKDKASIYISNIDYCGKDNTNVYESITCDLYETYDNKSSLISSCDKKDDMSLSDYLNSINISVDNYSSICRKIDKADLYLEIKAINKNGEVDTYNVPISMQDNC